MGINTTVVLPLVFTTNWHQEQLYSRTIMFKNKLFKNNYVQEQIGRNMFKNKYVQEQIVQEHTCSRTNYHNMFKNKCVQEQILIEQNMNRTKPSLIEQNMNRTNAPFKNMNRTRTRRTSNTAPESYPPLV